MIQNISKYDRQVKSWIRQKRSNYWITRRLSKKLPNMAEITIEKHINNLRDELTIE